MSTDGASSWTVGFDGWYRRAPASRNPRTYVDLSHPIADGMVTLPGLPAPQISVHLSRDRAREIYTPETTFEIGAVSMVANTGTYLDNPYHRFAEGDDLAALTLAQSVDLPAVVVRIAGVEALGIGPAALSSYDVDGKAVLLHTGDDVRFGTPGYVAEAHHLTLPIVEHLTGLADVPVSAATFTAAAPKVRRLGTFPVRAFATVQ